MPALDGGVGHIRIGGMVTQERTEPSYANVAFNRREVFTSAECQALIAWSETKRIAATAKIEDRISYSDGVIIRKHRRVVAVAPIRSRAVLEFQKKLRDVIGILNEQIWRFDITGFSRLSLLCFEGGDEVGPHIDVSGEHRERKLAAFVQLSPAERYRGGDLGFGLDYDPAFREQGSLVVFPSWVPHRVTPLTSGTRYSAICFALGPAFR